MKSLSKSLRIQTTALSLFLQSLLSITIGLIMIYEYGFFMREAKDIIFVYFGIAIVINTIQMAISYDKGWRGVIQSVVIILGAIGVLIYFYSNTDAIIASISLIMFMWTIILGISNFISFLQYRKEKSTAPIRYLGTFILNACFGAHFMRYIYNHLTVGRKLLGVYLVILGVMYFMDGLAIAIPSKAKNHMKKRVKIVPPAYIATFIPARVLNTMNDFLQVESENSIPFEVVKSKAHPNLEILVHVANTFRGTGGHIDIVIDDTIICYGTYDKESISLGGILGAGVFYEVFDKKAYLQFCKDVKKETLFEFGIVLSEDELNKVRNRLEEFKKRSYIWKSRAQRALEQNQDAGQYNDPSCLLAKTTKTVFHKFYSGSYKYYWLLGSNCAKFTDELLRASGMPRILTGIITPGTYFSYLNNEFANGNSNIVRRIIHYDSGMDS